MYLLDTTIIAELARNPHGAAAARAAELSTDDLGINPIVACEIEYGLARRGSSRLRQQVEAILSVVPTLKLPLDIARHYGRIRLELEKRGAPIGPNDLLIAAHAAAADGIVVTGNDREFRRVRGLGVENWIA